MVQARYLASRALSVVCGTSLLSFFISKYSSNVRSCERWRPRSISAMSCDEDDIPEEALTIKQPLGVSQSVNSSAVVRRYCSIACSTDKSVLLNRQKLFS